LAQITRRLAAKPFKPESRGPAYGPEQRHQKGRKMRSKWVASAICAAAIGCHALAAQTSGATAGAIVIEVKSLSTDSGTVYCDLFAGEKGFPNKPALAARRLSAKPRNGSATCTFTNVPVGRYAVAVWHDVDGDGKLDANFIGIPKEPVGSSNNAKGTMGPPRFRDAAFEVSGREVRQVIRLG
jgi:uncharacterized protein (DUF2141 family)